MQVIDHYLHKIEEVNSRKLIYKKKAFYFPFFRVGTIAIGVGLLFLLFNYSIVVAVACLLLSFIAFFIVAKRDQRNAKILTELDNLELAFNNEIKCKNGDFTFYPDGQRYVDTRHQYTSDLDIFGSFSIFQYINRTTLKVGSDLLAKWLRDIATPGEIMLRQEAVKELKEKFDWRFKLYVTGLTRDVNDTDPQKLERWLADKDAFFENKYFKMLVRVLPPVTLLSIALSFLFLPSFVPTLLVITQIIIIQFTKKEIKVTHASVTNTANLLMAYYDTLSVIENESYKSPKLVQLFEVFRLNKGNATRSLKSLARIIEGFDLRFSWMLHPILNPLLLWDLHHYMSLMQWKKENKDKVGQWIAAIGEFEALSSLANLSFNNPKWVMPKLTDSFHLEFREAGHPLIVEEKRVLNDFTMIDNESIHIVTGSNMAGKSTFLRTIGINMVLASAGSCVCATKFIFTPLKPLTSMRVFDDMRDNASTFYAELKRLETVLMAVKNGERVFLLLDEILRGTNSHDRHQGSLALIKQLVIDKAHGIIATHDIGLSELANVLPEQVKNFHFDAMVENDELYFDYKIHDGVCQSFNASLLLRKLGLDVR